MNNYQELQTEYYKRFPKELKLEFGVDVLINCEGVPENTITRVFGTNFIKSVWTTYRDKPFGDSNYKLLGKPLTLAMILRMLDDEKHFISYDDKGNIEIETRHVHSKRLNATMPLSLDPIDYPEETLLEICNLLDI